jgi:hypothetical protein
MAEMTELEQRAWELYCEDTRGDMAAVDDWSQVPKAGKERYLIQAAMLYNSPFDVLKQAADSISGGDRLMFRQPSDVLSNLFPNTTSYVIDASGQYARGGSYQAVVKVTEQKNDVMISGDGNVADIIFAVAKLYKMNGWKVVSMTNHSAYLNR